MMARLVRNILVIAMGPTQVTTELGQSAIQHATRQIRLLFFGYMISLVAGALFTYLLWKSGNDVQDAVTAEAKVEIATARDFAAQANKRSKELEESNLKLRERVATVEGTAAELQKSAADSKAAQQRVALDLEKQKERTAEAEKALLTLRSKVQDRSISGEQIAKFLAETKNAPKGLVTLNIIMSNPETITYGRSIMKLLSDAGWTVNRTSTLLTIGFGVSVRIDSVRPIATIGARSDFPSDSPVVHGAYLVQALGGIGIPVSLTVNSGPNVKADNVEITVSSKETSIPE